SILAPVINILSDKVDSGRVQFPFFFFFQAEDGIRDLIVTGVQTCALPICPILFGLAWRMGPESVALHSGSLCFNGAFLTLMPARSEERRVGKECRSRWSTYN